MELSKITTLKSYRQRFECFAFQYSFLWQLLIKHGTTKKLKNFILSKRELLERRAELKSRPLYLIIDTGNICNLKCPQCPTGLGLPGRKRRLMTFAEFKKIFDQLYEYALFVSLYNWGEPFLNPEVFRIISYVQKKNVGTIIGSNFTTVKEEDIDNILSSGLEHLVLSIDGASPETYSTYRRRGDFQKVIANVEKLVEKKRLLGKKLPLVRWQFLVNRFNEHEIEKAKEMGKALGVDAVTFYTRFKPTDFIFAFGNQEIVEEIEEWLPRKHLEYRMDYSKPFPRKGLCKGLWQSITVNSDGGVSPCCGLYDEKYDFGNLLKEPFTKVWNNQFYQASRLLFKKEAGKQVETVCKYCTLYAKANKEGLVR